MDKVVADVCKELQEAMKVNQLFTSPHLGYAIILEELDELWDEVKKKESKRDIKNMRAEAVQVAAMAMKFIMSMDNDWEPCPKIVHEKKVLARDFDEKEQQNEVKCKQCLYSFMTEQELAEIVNDPCDTCNDVCNWKPKEVLV